MPHSFSDTNSRIRNASVAVETPISPGNSWRLQTGIVKDVVVEPPNRLRNVKNMKCIPVWQFASEYSWRNPSAPGFLTSEGMKSCSHVWYIFWMWHLGPRISLVLLAFAGIPASLRLENRKLAVACLPWCLVYPNQMVHTSLSAAHILRFHVSQKVLTRPCQTQVLTKPWLKMTTSWIIM